MLTPSARSTLSGGAGAITTATDQRRGVIGYWPSVAEDEVADPRDRRYAKWLVDADKVVLSITLTEAPWERTRIVNAATAKVVKELKAGGEGDILVNTSASVIKPLLAADLVISIGLSAAIAPTCQNAGSDHRGAESVRGGTMPHAHRTVTSTWSMSR